MKIIFGNQDTRFYIFRKAKGNLAFIFQLLVTSGCVKQAEISFRTLLDEATVHKFLDHLQTRAMSPGRIYQLILAMIKALNFIVFASREQGVRRKASSLPTWNLLGNAAKIQKASERRRVRSKSIGSGVAEFFGT